MRRAQTYNIGMHGIGVDIIAIKRVRRVRERHPASFPRRILHADEMPEYQRSRNKNAFLAKRFALKEAISKALGRGFIGLSPSSVRIAHKSGGQPYVVLPDTVSKEHAQAHIHVSVSDEKEYAIAMAIAQ